MHCNWPIAPSLSARRAWIEIEDWLNAGSLSRVALRKESVDRNNAMQIEIVKMHTSLSARRAWIEIPALLGNSQNDGRRSPQGERG